jgi:4-amino-4-deoxychorismate lyase
MIVINGSVSAAVDARDRGLAYGDGVFRTLRVRGGRPETWPLHYAKLAQDCHALQIACPEKALLENELFLALGTEQDCIAKIIVTRGAGKRGYAIDGTESSTRIVQTSPLPAFPARYEEEGVRVHLCETRLCSQPRLAGVKHLNRLENVLARMEWNDPGIAEGLLFDHDGNLIEGTMTNVLLRTGTKLFTPDLSRCGVAGVTRDRIIAAAGSMGLSATVRNISLGMVQAAEEVLLCNSVIGVWHVRECGSMRWAPGALAKTVRQVLHDEID